MENDKHIPVEETPILRIMRPFQEFAANQSFGGIVLLFATLMALAWSNSPWAASYDALWHTPLTIGIGGHVVGKELHFWVNDGLMAVFFFVVGLEIKRQLLAGELASPRQAALPLMAAIGGVIVPAVIYTAVNAGGDGARGWAVPMATDIAFAIGVMALLGSRLPVGVKVFLTALAIVDDIAAVLVIALFYTSDISAPLLGIAGACLFTAFAANRLGVRHPLPYALIGILLWGVILQSGIHATIAGVLLALAIPSRTAVNQKEFLRHSRALLDHFKKAAETEPFDILSDIEQQTAVDALEDACEKVQSPLHRLEQALHPYVTFVIMPLFALANAGINLSGDIAGMAAQPITIGVVLGLALGKPLGVMAFSWLAVRTGIASLPENVTWRHIHGAGWLAGIGFTMSIFMAGLAFADAGQLVAAKLGILAASLAAGVTGAVILLRASPRG